MDSLLYKIIHNEINLVSWKWKVEEIFENNDKEWNWKISKFYNWVVFINYKSMKFIVKSIIIIIVIYLDTFLVKESKKFLS